MKPFALPALTLVVLASGCGSNAPNEPGCPVTSGVLAQCSGPPSDKVRLTVSVTGSSTGADALATAVQFFDNLGVKHHCYSFSAPAGVPSSCTAEFARGSEARIQRMLSLIDEDEGAWRLSLWGGACLGIDANTAPRGGQCNLTMDADKNVTVGFERRAKLTIDQLTLQPGDYSIRWNLAYSAQKAGGNPTTRAGTFDCSSTTRLPVCTIQDAYYDMGTVITVTAGNPAITGQPAFWKFWQTGCANSGTGRVCTVTLTAPSHVIVGVWGL